jgi:hypothetical protein
MKRWLPCVLAAVALASPPGAQGAAERTFCDRTIVAKVPWFTGFEPEPDGRLGFGPSSVRMRVLPRLVATGGKVGYELFLRPGAATGHPRWRVNASLARFHPRQNLHVFLDGISRQVRTIHPDRGMHFLFEVPDKPAYYFVSAFFTSPNGRRAFGNFRLYFKVIPATNKARLSLDAHSYSRGQTVFGRIENHGTVPVLYGAPYRIERYDGVFWTPAPESPKDFILPLYGASPGESGSECSPFAIPPSMAPGRYRMVKEVQFGHSNPEILTAEFDIAP